MSVLRSSSHMYALSLFFSPSSYFLLLILLFSPSFLSFSIFSQFFQICQMCNVLYDTLYPHMSLHSSFSSCSSFVSPSRSFPTYPHRISHCNRIRMLTSHAPSNTALSVSSKLRKGKGVRNPREPRAKGRTGGTMLWKRAAMCRRVPSPPSSTTKSISSAFSVARIERERERVCVCVRESLC